jgi:hypothetical protein
VAICWLSLTLVLFRLKIAIAAKPAMAKKHTTKAIPHALMVLSPTSLL